MLRSRYSVAKNGEEPPRKKIKKKKTSVILPAHTTISSLPDDLVLSCLARVSRSYYPTVSLVSKKFRSLIASPELYKVRSLLGLTESCLYVCLRGWSDTNFNPRWYTLYRRPDKTKKKKKKKKKKQKNSENILVPIPSFHYTQSIFKGVVAGSSIYSIGGTVDDSSVWILDCRSHTWHQAPNMLVARRYVSSVNVVDGKIYVFVIYNSSSWIEVFDPKTQIWNYVSSPGLEIYGNPIIYSTVIDGKICMYSYGGKCVAYNPKDGTCEPIEWVYYYSHCVIGNVLFCYHDHEGVFKWFDMTKKRLWSNLKGLDGMPKIARYTSVKLVDYGGKIAVLWEKQVSSIKYENKEIWCAVIAVERRSSEDEIWGTVEWSGVVFTVRESHKLVLCVLATTL